MTASPLAKGLFQRAIGQSGGLFEPLDLAAEFKLAGAEQEGQDFARNAGVASLRDLRQKPAADLMKVPFSTHLIIDGYALPRAPYDVYRKGQQNDVALLVGSNADEGQLMIAGRTITVANYAQELARDFPSFLVALAAPQPGTTAAQARAAAATFEKDMRFRWDMWTWACLGAQPGKRKVFCYEFSRVPPYSVGDKYFGMGASHGMEMPYVFVHLDQMPLAWTAQDRTLASTMAAYWTNFARSGDPNGAGLPLWPEFRTANQRVLELGAEIKPMPVPDANALHRIGRVYATARFVMRNTDLLGFGALVVAVALVGGLVARFRRRTARNAKQIATS